jgi:hypothetical protein
MRRSWRRGAWSVAAVLLRLAGWAGGATAQPLPPDRPREAGAVDAAREAGVQEYALRLGDAEARLRAAHERVAAAGASSSRPGAAPLAREELTNAVQDAWDAIRNAPPDLAGTEAHRAADRRFAEGLGRLRAGGTPPGAAADAAREMLQALAALWESAGAPAASPPNGTPGGAPAEPAAQGGRRG